MDIQYAQSAIFTPSDFAFPTNSIKAEATPNTEMTVIADVDLELLKELHNFGSVRTLRDRRKDMYEIVWAPRLRSTSSTSPMTTRYTPTSKIVELTNSM